MRRCFILLVLVLVLATHTFAHGDEDIEMGGQLVEIKVSCEELTKEQLVTIGEYLMEQMHPGEAHDIMHERMGLAEGTEAHDVFHINLARNMYCGERMGMMGTGPMMGPQMMQTGGAQMGYGMMGSGMMWGFGSILWTIILVGLAIMVWLWVIKLWKDIMRKK